MTVWRQQDWVWRVTAVVGLSLCLFAVLTWVDFFAHAWIPMLPDEMKWEPKDVQQAVLLSAPIVIVWLAMLRWGFAGWLWLAAWFVTGWQALSVLLLPSAAGPPHMDTDDVALFVRVVVAVSSQIWVGWAAGLSAPSTPGTVDRVCDNLTGLVWSRNPRVWRVFAVLGGVTLVVLSGSSAWIEAGQLLSSRNWFGSLNTCGWFLAELGIVAVLVLVWSSMITSGKAWLAWLLMWTLPVVRYLAMVIGGQTESASGALGVAYLLVAATQVWVALKAREMQRQRAASEVRRLV